MPGGASSTATPSATCPPIARQVGLLVYNTFVFIVSPVVTLQPMEPQICKIFLAFTNSIVVSVAATAVCVAIGSMAAYALARMQYKPKFGNIMMFVALTLLVIAATSYAGVPWWASTAVALALFFFLARAFGKHFTRTLGNGDILFWIISQRILPPIVVIIPIYMMFQAVGCLTPIWRSSRSMRWPTCPSSSGSCMIFSPASPSSSRSRPSSTARRALESSGTSCCRSPGPASPPPRFSRSS